MQDTADMKTGKGKTIIYMCLQKDNLDNTRFTNVCGDSSVLKSLCYSHYKVTYRDVSLKSDLSSLPFSSLSAPYFLSLLFLSHLIPSLPSLLFPSFPFLCIPSSSLSSPSFPFSSLLFSSHLFPFLPFSFGQSSTRLDWTLLL